MITTPTNLSTNLTLMALLLSLGISSINLSLTLQLLVSNIDL